MKMNLNQPLLQETNEHFDLPMEKYIKYEECIGVGAFKHVFKCINVHDGIEYAWNEINLEKLDPVTTSKIFQEIEFYRHLRHVNILQIFDVWFTEARVLVFTTELIVGGSLRDYLRKVHFELKLRVIENWGCEILSAMSYLHKQGIIHRDLKAENIYIDYVGGVLKIGDLGLATQKIFTDSDLIVNKQMSMVGTSEFMAPEIYFEKYDEKVDIYAFGMCLIEIITKEYPYEECHHTMEIYEKVTQGVLPDAIRKVTNEKAYELIVQCIEKEPEKRPTIKQILQSEFFTENFENEVISPESSGEMKPKNSTTFRPVISCNTPFIGQKEEMGRRPSLEIIVPSKGTPAPASSESQPLEGPLTGKALENPQNQFPEIEVQNPVEAIPEAPAFHISCTSTRIVDSQRVAEVLIVIEDEKFRWPISEKDSPEVAVKMLYEYTSDLPDGIKDAVHEEFKRICKELKDGVLGEQGI